MSGLLGRIMKTHVDVWEWFVHVQIGAARAPIDNRPCEVRIWAILIKDLFTQIEVYRGANNTGIRQIDSIQVQSCSICDNLTLQGNTYYGTGMSVLPVSIP